MKSIIDECFVVRIFRRVKTWLVWALSTTSRLTKRERRRLAQEAQLAERHARGEETRGDLKRARKAQRKEERVQQKVGLACTKRKWKKNSNLLGVLKIRPGPSCMQQI